MLLLVDFSCVSVPDLYIISSLFSFPGCQMSTFVMPPQVSSKWIRYPLASGYDTLGLHSSSTTAQPNVCQARRFQEVRRLGLNCGSHFDILILISIQIDVRNMIYEKNT